MFSIAAPAGMGQPQNHISWQLDDPTAMALSSSELPTVPPVLSDWESIFGLDISSMGQGSMFLIRSDVTSAVLMVIDSHGDGVPDGDDRCPSTMDQAIVDAQGCSLDQLAPCAGPASGGNWENHGEYLTAVQEAANEFLAKGLISEQQRNDIVTAAASNCGRK